MGVTARNHRQSNVFYQAAGGVIEDLTTIGAGYLGLDIDTGDSIRVRRFIAIRCTYAGFYAGGVAGTIDDWLLDVFSIDATGCDNGIIVDNSGSGIAKSGTPEPHLQWGLRER